MLSNVIIVMWALPSDKSSCIYLCDHMNGLKASSIVNVYDVSGKHKRNKNQSSSKL